MAQRALLVGINRYKMENSDLSGCVNDVTNIRKNRWKMEDRRWKPLPKFR